MTHKLQTLLGEIQALEKAVEEELHRASENVAFKIKDEKISFTKDVLKLHRSLRNGLVKYIFESRFLSLVSVPVIYSMIVPALVLDLFCWFYQLVCFPIYGIAKVDLKEYIRFDRHKLAYLNGIEKLNCDYCAYVNGILAYAREIASLTEQYWCPIRHALAVKGTHSRYSQFVEYGDANSYHVKLNELRQKLQEEQKTLK